MTGVLEMRMTHGELCAAIELWLRRELCRDCNSKNPVPCVDTVRQSRDKSSFVISLIDKE